MSALLATLALLSLSSSLAMEPPVPTIFQAVEQGVASRVQDLLSRARVEDFMLNGESLLHHAIDYAGVNGFNGLYILQLVLEAGCDVNEPNANGNTPLIMSLNSPNSAILETLLRFNPDLDQTLGVPEHGLTALRIALSLHDFDKADILLAHGATIDPPGAMSTFRYAQSLVDAEIMTWLQRNPPTPDNAIEGHLPTLPTAVPPALIPHTPCMLCNSMLDNGEAVVRIHGDHFFHEDCLENMIPHIGNNAQCPICDQPFHYIWDFSPTLQTRVDSPAPRAVVLAPEETPRTGVCPICHEALNNKKLLPLAEIHPTPKVATAIDNQASPQRKLESPKENSDKYSELYWAEKWAESPIEEAQDKRYPRSESKGYLKASDDSKYDSDDDKMVSYESSEKGSVRFPDDKEFRLTREENAYPDESMDESDETGSRHIFHLTCLRSLESHLSNSEARSDSMPCPMCRQPFSLPPQEPASAQVHGLESNH